VIEVARLREQNEESRNELRESKREVMQLKHDLMTRSMPQQRSITPRVTPRNEETTTVENRVGASELQDAKEEIKRLTAEVDQLRACSHVAAIAEMRAQEASHNTNEHTHTYTYTYLCPHTHA